MSEPIMSYTLWRTVFQALNGLKMQRKTRNEKRDVMKIVENVERELEPRTKIIGATSLISMSYPTYSGV